MFVSKYLEKQAVNVAMVPGNLVMVPGNFVNAYPVGGGGGAYYRVRFCIRIRDL